MHTTLNSDKRAIVVGAGIAGPVVAMALQRAGIRSTVHEARSAWPDESGAFLGLAPNGVNVLAMLGIDIERAADGYPAAGFEFFNADGKRIGVLDGRSERQRYGARSVVVKRGRLAGALREEALRRGIAMELGKRLDAIEVTEGQRVVARFEDGTAAEGDFLVGCDGIHSRTRRIILPYGPPPNYTGLIDTGGFAHCPGLAPTAAMQMTFGRRAFFGHLVKPGGEVFWFSNIPGPDEPTSDELRAISDEAWRDRLLELHADDPAPIPEIIRATTGGIGRWPSYDIPSLPAWHRGPVVLVGDAAHAATPHAGQGASMAMEDALVLAKSLRDAPDLEAAFATYEGLRKDRVERVSKQARRTGNQKALTNPLAARFRDLMLPLFLKLGASSMRRIYEYRVDWEQRAA